MPKVDLARNETLHPAAALSLGSLDFFRPRLLTIIRELTPDQLSAQPTGFANDVATLCLHLAAVEVGLAHAILRRRLTPELLAEYKLDHPLAGPLPRKVAPSLAQAEGESAESLIAKLEKSRALLGEAMTAFTEADMDREFPINRETTATIRWALGMLPMHQAQHLGQIQMLLKQL